MVFLAALGAIALVALAYIAFKLAIAFYACCDAGTALTPTLKTDAFKGDVVWITGASSGIGKCMALLLASRGAKLILSSRRKGALEEVANECRALNPNVSVRILPLDLNDSADKLQEKAREALAEGPIDLLINNGGVSTRVLANGSSLEVDIFLTQVDYLAHVIITKTLLASSPPSRIINVGSIASKVGVPVRTAYCGAKHALQGYMDALRVECIMTKTPTCILNACLGSVRTNLAQNAVVGSTNGQVTTFGHSDPNIEQGLDPNFVAETILAVSHKRALPECWLANRKELVVLYVNQYFPQTGMSMLLKKVAQKYTVVKKKDE